MKKEKFSKSYKQKEKKEQLQKIERSFNRPFLILLCLLFFAMLAFLCIIIVKNLTGNIIGIDPLNTDDPLGVGINQDNMPKDTAELQAKASDYTTQRILNNTSLGRFFLGTSNVLKSLSPGFKLLTGVEYSLSWFFFIAVFLWAFVFVVLFWLAKDLLPEKTLLDILIALAIPTIAAQTGIIRNVAGKISQLFTNPIVVISLALLLIIFLIFYSQFMKSYGKSLEEKIKQEERENREMKEKTLSKINDLKLRAHGIE